MSYGTYRDRCDSCGRFISFTPGVSWSQSWHYEMGGSPCLDDPTYRCAPCTERLGVEPSNCAGPGGYSGILPPPPDPRPLIPLEIV